MQECYVDSSELYKYNLEYVSKFQPDKRFLPYIVVIFTINAISGTPSNNEIANNCSLPAH